MTLCVAALYDAEPAIKAIGCCHEVFGTQRHLMQVLNDHFGLEGEDAISDRREIVLDVSGVNHFTLSTAARWRDVDIMPILRERLSAPDFFADQTAAVQEFLQAKGYMRGTYRVPYDLLRRLDVFGTAGSRHLVENVPWYLNDGEAGLHRWGVMLTPYQYRLDIAQEKRQ